MICLATKENFDQFEFSEKRFYKIRSALHPLILVPQANKPNCYTTFRMCDKCHVVQMRKENLKQARKLLNLKQARKLLTSEKITKLYQILKGSGAVDAYSVQKIFLPIFA